MLSQLLDLESSSLQLEFNINNSAPSDAQIETYPSSTIFVFVYNIIPNLLKCYEINFILDQQIRFFSLVQSHSYFQDIFNDHLGSLLPLVVCIPDIVTTSAQKIVVGGEGMGWEARFVDDRVEKIFPPMRDAKYLFIYVPPEHHPMVLRISFKRNLILPSEHHSLICRLWKRL